MIQKSYSFGLLRKIKLWKVLEVLVMWRQLTGNSFVRRKWENIEAPIGDIKNVVDWHEVNPHNVCNFTVSLIWNRHGHECSRIWKLTGKFTLIQCIKKCRDFLGRDISGTTYFRAESSLIQSSCRSFIGVIVPYEISKVNFRVKTKILVSMSEEIK